MCRISGPWRLVEDSLCLEVVFSTKESVRITVPSTCQVPDRRIGATRRMISVCDEMNEVVGLPYCS